MLITCKNLKQFAKRISEGLVLDFEGKDWYQKVENNDTHLPVECETYRTFTWKADNGNIYMTDEWEKVPKKYHKKYIYLFLPALYMDVVEHLKKSFTDYRHTAICKVDECVSEYISTLRLFENR